MSVRKAAIDVLSCASQIIKTHTLPSAVSLGSPEALLALYEHYLVVFAN